MKIFRFVLFFLKFLFLRIKSDKTHEGTIQPSGERQTMRNAVTNTAILGHPQGQSILRNLLTNPPIHGPTHLRTNRQGNVEASSNREEASRNHNSVTTFQNNMPGNIHSRTNN